MTVYDVIRQDGAMLGSIPDDLWDDSGWAENGDVTIQPREGTYEEAVQQCHRLRAREYPPLGDFADAMVHAQLGDGAPLAAYYAACAAVKAKWPKPAVPNG